MRGETNVTRRTLLGSVAILGAASAAFGAAAALPPYARADDESQGASGDGASASPKVAKGADASAQYGFLVRADHCVNCGECVAACRHYNKTPDGEQARRKLVAYTTAAGRAVTVSTACMHCEDPACLRVCPAGAISKGAGGIVTVDKQRCIGCKYCYQACPYGVPHYNEHGMDKCDFCFEAGVALGERTHCVQACHVDALLCGRIDELIARYPDAQRIEGPVGASCYLSPGSVV